MSLVKALEILKSKSKNLRILETKVKSRAIGTLRQVAGGFLLQQEDALTPDEITFTCVSEVQPTEEQLEDLKFAWTCVKHVKSNAITVAKNRQLLGMGSGQPNRVKSVDISLEKAKDEIKVGLLFCPEPKSSGMDFLGGSASQRRLLSFLMG